MYFVMKIIATVVISVMMQAGTESIVATTPREAVLDFMEGLENRDTYVMEKYMDDSYVNFITNVQGDEAVVERMNDALFSGFTYKIEDMAVKNDVAVAKVTITSCDFSGVLDAYNTVSYQYVVDNLYTDEIADKDWLSVWSFMWSRWRRQLPWELLWRLLCSFLWWTTDFTDGT